VPLPSFRAVADEVAARHVQLGVLPIESSVSGPVAETHDLLFESPLAVVAQTVLPIRHQLAGPAAVELHELRVVRSHPHALEQCRRLLASLPQADAVAAATTADAARIVSEEGDPTHAAITSPRAAELYELVVLDHDVGDHPEAFTRFVAIATHLQLERDEAIAYRTSFSFVTDHRPGALHDALEPFARLEVDLHHLSSRPIPQTPWRYRFDAVLAGHPLEPPIRQALAEAASRTRRLLVSGVYPE
jgi:chorismate mutase / prephenate dehydratase